MLSTGVSRVYLLLVGLTALQPVLFVAGGGLTDVSTRGAAFVACLLVWLAYRSRIAWALLVVTNAVPLAAGAAMAMTTLPWAWSVNLYIVLLTGALLEAVLLSSAMRRYIAPSHPGAGAALRSSSRG
jgi:hypothetical protein